ncbi:ComF family protein [Candidatus Methylobacter oryzae]|uniref:ComF family protein n=1 Tax=Candidatus Methylobacter oryzae TaxID=2497749 RepID=A0ABY3CBL6_9GAMM|nr:ComF family protein [Candidatus Methylobacter oryzae]TRW96480.1 ComF family protein [Candidatus Methylobacter oryzae]
MVYNWIDIIQDYLLPPTCILCGNPGQQARDICDSCYMQLPRNNHCCYRCGEILETLITAPALCGRCLSRQPAFDETYAPFIHQGAIRHLINTLKFSANYKNARLLGMLLADHLRQSAEQPELILPVPLHDSRYRERGFNQAIEISRTVAKELQVPLDLTGCKRCRDTPHQIQLSAKKRHKNLKNAFSVVKPLHAQHIAILDDVMTTGSTAHELAYVLKKAGANRVDVWVCARA